MLIETFSELINGSLIFADLFRKYRLESNLPKRQIALLLKLSAQYIQKIENGEKIPSFSKCQELIKIFEIKTSREKLLFLGAAFIQKIKNKDDYNYLKALYSFSNLYNQVEKGVQTNLKNKKLKLNDFQIKRKVLFYSIELETAHPKKILQEEKYSSYLIYLLSSGEAKFKVFLPKVDIYPSSIKFILGIPVEINIQELVNNIKTYTEKEMKNNFNELSQLTPKLWHSDYSIKTIEFNHYDESFMDSTFKLINQNHQELVASYNKRNLLPETNP